MYNQPADRPKYPFKSRGNPWEGVNKKMKHIQCSWYVHTYIHLDSPGGKHIHTYYTTYIHAMEAGEKTCQRKKKREREDHMEPLLFYIHNLHTFKYYRLFSFACSLHTMAPEDVESVSITQSPCYGVRSTVCGRTMQVSQDTDRSTPYIYIVGYVCTPTLKQFSQNKSSICNREQ